MMFSIKLVIFDHDRSYGGIRNVRSNWGNSWALSAAAWLHHEQYRFNVDRKRAEMRFKRDYMDKHTNTHAMLPAPRVVALLPAVAISAHPVQLFLPVGEYVAGYHPGKIERIAS